MDSVFGGTCPAARPRVGGGQQTVSQGETDIARHLVSTHHTQVMRQR